MGGKDVCVCVCGEKGEGGGGRDVYKSKKV